MSLFRNIFSTKILEDIYLESKLLFKTKTIFPPYGVVLKIAMLVTLVFVSF